MRVRLLWLLALVVAGLCAPVAGAHAATPQAWGFAYVDVPNAVVWTDLDRAHQWGSWKPSTLWAQGRRLGAVYQVKFPNIGLGVSRGVVHVTAVGPNSNGTNEYCHAVRWYAQGVDEIVEVKCQRPLSTEPSVTRFTVLWTLSPGVVGGQGTHAYLHKATGQSYNSAGGANTIAGTNPYFVRFSGVGTNVLAGNLQVTAVGPAQQALRCKVMSWGGTVDVSAYVLCYNQAGALPVNVDFVASYHNKRAVFGAGPPQAPANFGYLWCQNGFAPNNPTNYNTMLGPNMCGNFAVGRYVTSYEDIHVNETHYQVTAQGASLAQPAVASSYCNITTIWIPGDPVRPWVDCYDNAGARVNNNFLAAFTSSRP